jgi:hypothetical protein
MSKQDDETKAAMFYFLAGGLVDTTSQDDLDSLRNDVWPQIHFHLPGKRVYRGRGSFPRPPSTCNDGFAGRVQTAHL